MTLSWRHLSNQMLRRCIKINHNFHAGTVYRFFGSGVAGTSDGLNLVGRDFKIYGHVEMSDFCIMILIVLKKKNTWAKRHDGVVSGLPQL